MIWFYRDFLDGPLYVVVAILSLIFTMAIIGFIMERLQLKRDEENRIAVLNGEIPVPPIGVESSALSTPKPTIPNSQTVVPQEVIQKSQNAATNEKIPEVLDLNVVEEQGTQNNS